MPDQSDRIRKSAINAMLNLLLILAVFNTKTLPEELHKHPKIAVVFNNVSKQKDPKEAQERIQKYKALLSDKAYEFYCFMISDET